MFYELYRDRGNVIYGGRWFDPDSMELIEVLDLDSASGVDGTNAVLAGTIFADEDRIREAAKTLGWEFQPPTPPPAPEGPREWMPKSYLKAWEPPAQPGQLFWTPETPLVEKVSAAWNRFEELERQLHNGQKAFEALDGDDRGRVLIAAQGIHDYFGFDGGPEKTYLVIEKSSENADQADALVHEWGATDGVVTKNPEMVTWKILKRWGIKRPKKGD